jgi:hypothetical protein
VFQFAELLDLFCCGQPPLLGEAAAKCELATNLDIPR